MPVQFPLKAVGLMLDSRLSFHIFALYFEIRQMIKHYEKINSEKYFDNGKKNLTERVSYTILVLQ